MKHEIVRQALIYACEEMGALLRRSAFSPNIREREDFSCAIYDADGELIAQAEHIPVHLGSMRWAVRAVLDEFKPSEMEPGDAFLLNDPYSGGTHLPDLTIVAPVFHDDELMAFAVVRAHHADVGGKVPGSMPHDAEDVYSEGLRIPPIKVAEDGETRDDVLRLLEANSRGGEERRYDLAAQIAAAFRGCRQVRRIIDEHGCEAWERACEWCKDYAERRMRVAIERVPDGEYTGEDYLEGDGISEDPVRISVTVLVEEDEVTVDFTGTDEQTRGPVNAPLPVTYSAVFFALKAALDPETPVSEGTYRPIEVIAPRGTVVNPEPPAPVCAGNVETSQRIVDAILDALREAISSLPAHSHGSMNNVAIGGAGFAYYETVGGGAGASPDGDGESAVHVYMTNTASTPVEHVEREYPIRILEYTVRRGSGGEGKYRGGDGIVKRYLALERCRVTVIGDRIMHPPRGVDGGKPGKTSEYEVERSNGKVERLGPKDSTVLEPGDMLVVRTAGGGGYGSGE
ncbi:hydantoinase B/oxoprolinase family protein [Methanopyrus sp.]